MATPAAGQEQTFPPALSRAIEEDIKISHTHLTEDNEGLRIDKERFSTTHLKSKAVQDVPASPGREANQAEGSNDLAADSRQNSDDSPSTLMLEISNLRDKLHFLEETVGKASDKSDIKQHRQIEDERQLRKQIRRARFAKNWVDEAEACANQNRDERLICGHGGNLLQTMTASDPGSHPDDIAGDGNTNFRSEEEWKLWSRERNKPGLRPPTSLRRNYSRKLGPPTEWDMSDSEEWSSDGSICTRDFDYFRARLRGDFEWELDRLAAQKRRFELFKRKKQAKAEREAQLKSGGRVHVNEGDDGEEAEDKEEEETEELYKPPVLQPAVNRVEWGEFTVSRFTVARSSFIIDILVGEPQILGNFFQQYRSKYLEEKTIPHRSKAVEGHQGQKGEGAGQGSSRMAVLDGGAPLPERIRIHSKEIIRTLAIIHGSELTSDDMYNSSVVMLRPYRMLTYYENEIRQWHSRLEEQYRNLESDAEAEPAANDEAPPKDAGAKDDDENEDTDSTQEEMSGVADPEGLSKSKTALEHLTCLLKFMGDYVHKRLDYLKSSSCEKIFFSDIWHLFKPGGHVISADGKQIYQIFNVTSTPHIGEERFSKFAKEDEDSREAADGHIVIQCIFIHFDGRQIGPVVRNVSIPKFDGEKAVTLLKVYPLRFHVRKKLERQIMARKPTGDELDKSLRDGVAKLQETLIERGKLFTKVAAVKHMYYSGLTVDTRDEIQSQVMIDFAEAFLVEKNGNWRPEVKHLVGMIEISNSPRRDALCTALCCAEESVHNDIYVDNKRHHDFMKEMLRGVEDGVDDLPPAAIYPRPLETLKTGGSPLTRDDFLIMSYTVFGFVLRDRSWAQLDLTHLTHVTDSVDASANGNDDETEDDKTAFGRLVLPPGHKNMVLSLVSQHFRNKAAQRDRDSDEQVDIVRGKGKGLIILLHGAPGVGKTTTAEGVAEKFKKPLFQITCGDLGSSPNAVEDALQTNFALANRWGCILLLDEADVFLAERRRDDFNRNGLVAVFLRVLEYYAGILFLTTNRIGDFDEAFASRIHMSLHYPPLKLVSTSKIFELNLKMIKKRYQEADRKIMIDIQAIGDYAEEYWQRNVKARLNGRQIRNACQTALALAEFDAQPEGSKYDLTVRSDAKVHLTVKHIQTVSDVYLEFIEYLKAVHGTDAETHANEAGLRALETAYLAMRSGAGHRGMGSAEVRRNPLHSFKLQAQPSQSQTQMRPNQGNFALQRRQGPSYDAEEASMGPYNTPPRMGGPQPGMALYQATTMSNPSYQQHPNNIPAVDQFHHSGGQQRLSPSQHRSYSQSPSSSTGQYQHLTGDATSQNMTSIYGQSTEPFGQQDPRSGNIWPTNVERINNPGAP